MKRKGLYIVAGILVAVVLACFLYVFAGTKRTEKLMREYLDNKGYTTEEIRKC